MAAAIRPYDLVLFGATGYTGKLTAQHITTSLPTDLKWALAGRSATKLEAVAAECKALDPDRVQPAIEICNLNDTGLAVLSKKTTVLISTVGPYSKFGEHAFKACAENGTHYLDVTGEVPWVAQMIKKYEATAKANGAIMIPQNGIESALADLITYSLTSIIRKELSAPTAEVILSVHEFRGTPSGGTTATVLELLDLYTLKEITTSMSPYNLSPIPGPKTRVERGIVERVLGVRSVRDLGTLTTSIAGSTDAPIVQRTWGLLGGSRAYGPQFCFKEYMRARNSVTGFFLHVAITIIPAFLLFKPVRSLLKRFVFAPGEGVDEAAQAKEVIEYRAVAKPDMDNPTSHAFCRARYTGKGGMYYLTGVLLAEAAISILRDDSKAIELGGGILTPALLGQNFINRLGDAGFKIETRLVDN